MAKGNVIKIKLASTADTGFFYVTKKNSRTTSGRDSRGNYRCFAEMGGPMGSEREGPPLAAWVGDTLATRQHQ